MRRANEENERIKRQYLQYLRVAMRKDPKTVLKAAEHILRFEASLDYAIFKKFRIEHAVKFQERLRTETSRQTAKPLAKSTVRSILAANKAFIFWLADQPGYKSRIRHSDADYFNMDAKGARIAGTVRHTPYPSMQMARHAFAVMPTDTEINRRNKAIFAFFMLTGARDGAVASLRLKHINLLEGYVFQDARDVRTKNAKTITTYFLPVDPEYRVCFEGWVTYLTETALFGPDDALFPPPKLGLGEAGFEVVGLQRDVYRSANTIRQVIKAAFVQVDLPPFTPHAFRKKLVKWANQVYQTRESFKAFSQNIGHSSVLTTVSAYCPVSIERQGELIGRPQQSSS